MIKLVPDPSLPIIEGKLSYAPEDYAFGFDPIPKRAEGALCVVMLQLCVDLTTYQIVCLFGYEPYTTWNLKHLKPPHSTKAGLRVAERELLPYVGVELQPKTWPRQADPNTGWVCLGDCEAEGDAIEFLPSCIAVLSSNGELRALWLHPEKFPSSAGSFGSQQKSQALH